MKRIIKNILRIAFGSGRLKYLIRKVRGGYYSINQLDEKLEQYVITTMVFLSSWERMMALRILIHSILKRRGIGEVF